MKPKPFAKWMVGLSSTVFIGLAIGQLSVSSNGQSTTPVSTGDTYSNETTFPSQPTQGDSYDDEESDDDGGYYDDNDDEGWSEDDSSGFSQPSGNSDGRSSHSK
ncbi:hypothetical protein [Exiguobacterium sp. s193]|uniref:hypothetical protein n=1 Tax=Exiguobacterium sp. s193 TaxID=2751207 RepID=UPI001BEB7E19|nr:hypothetical protein [Exiguobacterium sp. s193]